MATGWPLQARSARNQFPAALAKGIGALAGQLARNCQRTVPSAHSSHKKQHRAKSDNDLAAPVLGHEEDRIVVHVTAMRQYPYAHVHIENHRAERPYQPAIRIERLDR